MITREEDKVGRFLCMVLRHKPEALEVQLDSAGWISVRDLLTALNRHGKPFTREQLDRVVAENDKQRFEFSQDRTCIRASQGHSIDVKLGYQPVEPPPFLYHGTTYYAYNLIKREGLNKRQRHTGRNHSHPGRQPPREPLPAENQLRQNAPGWTEVLLLHQRSLAHRERPAAVHRNSRSTTQLSLRKPHQKWHLFPNPIAWASPTMWG